MQDLNKIWSSCVETLEKNKIVDDKIILDSLFKPATLEEIEDNQVIITTELKWNIDAILEKRAEIESILSNSFSKFLICLVTAGCEICKISLAFVKFSSSATILNILYSSKFIIFALLPYNIFLKLYIFYILF